MRAFAEAGQVPLVAECLPRRTLGAQPAQLLDVRLRDLHAVLERPQAREVAVEQGVLPVVPEGGGQGHGAAEPPPYLQDAHYPGARNLGRGTGYEYPHGLPDGVSDQPLLPEGLRDRRYYEPTDRGFEAKLTERLAALRKRLRKAGS